MKNQLEETADDDMTCGWRHITVDNPVFTVRLALWCYRALLPVTVFLHGACSEEIC